MEIEKAQIEGQLIPAQDVAAAWTEVFANCRAKILSIPTKTAAEVFGADSLHSIKGILKTAVNEALTELANVEIKTNNPIRSQSIDRDDETMSRDIPTAS